MGKKSRAKRERRERREKNNLQSLNSLNRDRAEVGSKRLSNNSNGLLERICLTIIRWSIYLMLLTPLVVSGHFFFPFVAPKGLYLMALIEIAFFSWLILAIYRPEYRPKKNLLLWSFSAFLVISIIATIFGADPSRSFWSKFERMSGLLMWLHLFALFLVSTSVLKTKQAWRRIFSLSTIIATIVSIMFLVGLTGVKGLPIAKDGSTLGNSSFLGTYLLFSLYFMLYLLFDVWKNKKNFRLIYSLLLILTIIISFVALALSTATAAFLSFLGGLGIMIILWLAFEPKKKILQRAGKIILAFSIVIFITSIIFLYVPNSIVQKQLVKARGEARPLLWQSAEKGFLQRPVLGWGPQNFLFVFNQNFNPCFYIGECGGETRFDQAHNIIMDNLIDGGALGLIAYLSIYISAIYILWKSYSKKRINFWTASIPTALLIAHFTQNLTVFDMPVSFLMLVLTLGFVGFVANREISFSEVNNGDYGHKRKELTNLSLVSLAVLILFLLSFSNFVVKPMRANFGIIKAMMASRSNNSGQIPFYQQALYSSPMGKYQIRTYLGEELIKKAQSQKECSKEEFQMVIESLEQSIKSAPLDYFSHLILGRTYNTYGILTNDKKEKEKAEKVLEKAVFLAPTKQAAYWDLAKVKFLLGKRQESIALAEKAVNLEPRLAYGHTFLVNIILLTGDKQLAVQKAQEAIKILPSLEPQLKAMLKVKEL